jgi:hypothetical protein
VAHRSEKDSKSVRIDSIVCRWSLAAILSSAGLCAGCYNSEALVEHARSVALNTRLAEVDLGKYHTTLPRDPQTGLFTELDLHIFGNVPRYRVPEIEIQLKTEEYRLRHEMLAALRRSTRDELAEPNLTKLRARIEKVINSMLDQAPVKSIGFFTFRLREI